MLAVSQETRGLYWGAARAEAPMCPGPWEREEQGQQLPDGWEEREEVGGPREDPGPSPNQQPAISGLLFP